MEWLVSLAPVLGPLFGTAGALGGAWLVYHQARRKDQAEASINSVRTVTDGFATLLDQQRAAHDQTLERVATLEARQMDLERRVESLQEEQRQSRQWKAMALDYIHALLETIRSFGRPAPEPPREIAEDVAADR
ncbi:hypothetical protein [Streptomyces sp. NPDC093707]|uniref:hypothetical protein n=1 Tax=Streptomyces sp. NPDC093707 TaxID=3154984 RepID=UPI00344CAA2E